MDGVLGAAYTASLGQRVPAVSRKCPLAGLLQFVVARVLYDGFKSCLCRKDAAIRSQEKDLQTSRWKSAQFLYSFSAVYVLQMSSLRIS